jgi:peptidylprolyl isomerase
MSRRTLLAAAVLAALSLAAPGCGEPADPDEAKATVTPSGLKYFDVKVGDGKEARAGSIVEVHYVGKLRDGRKFDSSRDKGKPFSFLLGAGRVIKGWDEGVIGMKVGGRRKLYIPPGLGYGASGAGDLIPPHSDLLFDVELLDVKSPVEIEDLKVGEGPEAKSGDMVEVHYTGWLRDGRQFDSSRDRGEPFSFPLGAGKVIKGWDVGVAGMKVGGKRKLTISPEFAYGSTGKGDIPPDSELRFEIELLSIKGGS